MYILINLSLHIYIMSEALYRMVGKKIGGINVKNPAADF